MFTYGRGVIENGVLIIKDEKQIDQSKLTMDCWLIQFNGLDACKGCEFKNTPECGGGETLKKTQTKLL